MSEENGRTDLTWRELLDEGGARLSEAGVPDAGTDAWYLMEAAFGIDRVHYYLDQNRPIHAERLEKGYGRYQEMLQKRAERIPLQQILGMQDFMGMTFSVDENVLIPRQDTETLVERVLRDYPEKDLKLLDMCTGSGCILLSIVKLAAELSKRSTGKTIYILDEPTTGLHFADVHKLVEILRRLSDGGNTVVVIEHNLDVIKTADYIIDMGPEGGDRGGTVIAKGTPEEIVKVPESYTGQYVKRYLENGDTDLDE